MVIIENTVDSTTHLVASTASQPYFSASTAVVLPAGIPVRVTITPCAVPPQPAALHRSSAKRGSSSRRTAE